MKEGRAGGRYRGIPKTTNATLLVESYALYLACLKVLLHRTIAGPCICLVAFGDLGNERVEDGSQILHLGQSSILTKTNVNFGSHKWLVYNRSRRRVEEWWGWWLLAVK
jgi:hypothetical protein